MGDIYPQAYSNTTEDQIRCPLYRGSFDLNDGEESSTEDANDRAKNHLWDLSNTYQPSSI